MSRYQFRKPTIGQQIDMTIAAVKGDMPAMMRLLDVLAVDDILDLPFTEIAVVARDYAYAMQAWQDETTQDELPADMVDYLANLLGEEDE